MFSRVRGTLVKSYWITKNVPESSLLSRRLCKMETPSQQELNVFVETAIPECWDALWRIHQDYYRFTRIKDDLQILFNEGGISTTEPVFHRKTALEYAAQTLLDTIITRPPIHLDQSTLDMIWSIFHITLGVRNKTSIELTLLRFHLFRHSKKFFTLTQKTQNFLNILHDHLVLLDEAIVYTP